MLAVFCCLVLSLALLALVSEKCSAQTDSTVPVMDGGAGPCVLDLTVKGPDGKPVYDATVKVHIAYGFAGAHRLDLQAGTNADGRVKFTGLPARVHRPPVEFDAAKGELQATLDYDPMAECQAKHDMTLEAAKPQSQQ